MTSEDCKDILMTLSKLILFAETYIGINISLARFYMMEADTIRRGKQLAAISTALLCPRCWLIMRPETCNITLLSNVKAKQHILKLAKLCRQAVKQQQHTQSRTLVKRTCVACKHQSVESCMNSKPPKALTKSGVKVSKNKQLVPHSVTTSKSHQSTAQSCKSTVLADKRTMKPNDKQTNMILDTTIKRKSSNQKRDLKLKHNSLQNILRAERESRAMSNVDCLRQFFSSM